MFSLWGPYSAVFPNAKRWIQIRGSVRPRGRELTYGPQTLIRFAPNRGSTPPNNPSRNPHEGLLRRTAERESGTFSRTARPARTVPKVHPEVLRPGRTLKAPQALNRGSLAGESEIPPPAFLGSRRLCYAFNIIHLTIITLIGSFIRYGRNGLLTRR